jgi:hypothetical protein
MTRQSLARGLYGDPATSTLRNNIAGMDDGTNTSHFRLLSIWLARAHEEDGREVSRPVAPGINGRIAARKCG